MEQDFEEYRIAEQVQNLLCTCLLFIDYVVSIKHWDACYVGLRKSNIESVRSLGANDRWLLFFFFRCAELMISVFLWSHAFRYKTFEFCFEPPLVTDACSYFNIIAKVFKSQILRFICSTHCTLSK